ncbi:MAG TPA: hypothetical protein VGG19_05060 [Tepidisphaeraceae bacterium]|jgi:hypothetical protein
MMRHRQHDIVGLEIAKRVATGLPSHPEWIELAKTNLSRWKKRNHDSASLVACYEEWEHILQQPMSEIISILLTQTEQGTRLRQNSPFAGVLSAADVWRIKRQINEATAA